MQKWAERVQGPGPFSGQPGLCSVLTRKEEAPKEFGRLVHSLSCQKVRTYAPIPKPAAIDELVNQ